MSVRQVAEKDIRESLKVQGKSFLAFREELNSVMDELVNEQIKSQKSCGNSKKEM